MVKPEKWQSVGPRRFGPTFPPTPTVAPCGFDDSQTDSRKGLKVPSSGRGIRRADIANRVWGNRPVRPQPLIPSATS